MLFFGSDFKKAFDSMKASTEALTGKMTDLDSATENTRHSFKSMADSVEEATKTTSTFAEDVANFGKTAAKSSEEIASANRSTLAALKSASETTGTALTDIWQSKSYALTNVSSALQKLQGTYKGTLTTLKNARNAAKQGLVTEKSRLQQANISSTERKETVKSINRLTKVMNKSNAALATQAARVTIVGAVLLVFISAITLAFRAQSILRKAFIQTNMGIAQQDEYITKLSNDMIVTGASIHEVAEMYKALASQNMKNKLADDAFRKSLMQTMVALELSGKEAVDLAFKYDVVFQKQTGGFKKVAAAIKAAATSTSLTKEESMEVVQSLDRMLLRYDRVNFRAIPAMLALADATKRLGGESDDFLELMTNGLDLSNSKTMDMRNLMLSSGQGYQKMMAALESKNPIAAMKMAQEGLKRIAANNRSYFIQHLSDYESRTGFSRKNLLMLWDMDKQDFARLAAKQKEMERRQKEWDTITKNAETALTALEKQWDRTKAAGMAVLTALGKEGASFWSKQLNKLTEYTAKIGDIMSKPASKGGGFVAGIKQMVVDFIELVKPPLTRFFVWAGDQIANLLLRALSKVVNKNSIFGGMIWSAFDLDKYSGPSTKGPMTDAIPYLSPSLDQLTGIGKMMKNALPTKPKSASAIGRLQPWLTQPQGVSPWAKDDRTGYAEPTDMIVPNPATIDFKNVGSDSYITADKLNETNKLLKGILEQQKTGSDDGVGRELLSGAAGSW